MMRNHERKIAHEDSEELTASEKFFLYRPNRDTEYHRTLFREGFRRGWIAAQEQNAIEIWNKSQEKAQAGGG